MRSAINEHKEPSDKFTNQRLIRSLNKAKVRVWEDASCLGYFAK